MKQKAVCISLALMICLLAAFPVSAETFSVFDIRSYVRFSAGHSQRNDGSIYYWGRMMNTSIGDLSIVVQVKNASGVVVSSSSNSLHGSSIEANNTVYLSSGSYTIEISGIVSGVAVSSPILDSFTV